MEIAVDFDGTCVTHDYPRIGKNIDAQDVLTSLVDNGHKLILYTMRSGKELDAAVAWFKENDIELYGIQKNPTQHTWTESNKCYANCYIDDAALGCPLIFPESGERPYVDWHKVKTLLMLRGVL